MIDTAIIVMLLAVLGLALGAFLGAGIVHGQDRQRRIRRRLDC
jgi:hypothetical protein